MTSPQIWRGKAIGRGFSSSRLMDAGELLDGDQRKKRDYSLGKRHAISGKGFWGESIVDAVSGPNERDDFM